tara:strand:- start:718 stop:822 length:105 start_codon:yes stop_codon:yes gene_type:complete
MMTLMAVKMTTATAVARLIRWVVRAVIDVRLMQA